MFLKSLFACSSLISCVNRGGQASFSAPAVCLYLTSFHAACQCQMYYSISFLSSLLPISLTACCCSSPAYNWIWVWNRRAVGSEIKEGRLSLHLRWGTQISPNFLSPRTTFSQSFHFWSTEHLLIQKVGNSDKNSVIILIEKSHTVCINWTVYSCALVCGFIPRANLEFEVYCSWWGFWVENVCHTDCAQTPTSELCRCGDGGTVLRVLSRSSFISVGWRGTGPNVLFSEDEAELWFARGEFCSQLMLNSLWFFALQLWDEQEKTLIRVIPSLSLQSQLKERCFFTWVVPFTKTEQFAKCMF